MYCVGLTGTIASGKSTAAACFTKEHITVISADHIARQLTTTEEPAFKAIIDHFGISFLTPFGTLNRAHLREVIFHDPKERLWLEQLLHPLIRARIESAVQEATSALCVIEIPLLTDRSLYPYLNRVLLILAPLEQQIKRLMKRDHCSKNQAELILDTQQDEQTYRKIADDIIINNGDLAQFKSHIEQLQKEYLGSVDNWCHGQKPG